MGWMFIRGKRTVGDVWAGETLRSGQFMGWAFFCDVLCSIMFTTYLR